MTSSPKKLNNRTQEGSLSGYTNNRATMKWWYPHTKKLKYCSSENFDEHKNKFGKRWSPGSELMLGKNTSTLPTLIFDLSDHPFIKDNIFEFDLNLTPIGTPIDIATQYCEHHNMSYISQLKKNSPRNHFFPSRNMTNFWILGIGRKEPTTFHFVLESISSQQLIGKCNRVHVITFRRYKDIIRTNLQGNICTFNQIRHIHYIEEKLSSLRTKLPTPYHIGDVVKKFLRSE